GRVVDRDAALAHHLFEIAVADAIAAVPAHRPEHDLTFKMAALEVRHSLAPPRSDPSSPGADGFATEPAGVRFPQRFASPLLDGEPDWAPAAARRVPSGRVR